MTIQSCSERLCSPFNTKEVELARALLQSQPELWNIPLPMDDIYEYWLLDEDDQIPLTLLASCRHSEEMEAATGWVHWEPVSAAELKPVYDEQQYEP